MPATRIAQIDTHGGIEGYDVVIKPVAASPYLSLRRTFDSMDEVIPIIRTVADACTSQISRSLRDKLIVVARNDLEDESLDLEIGYSLTRSSNMKVRIGANSMLQASELPAAPAMATIVRSGINAASHSAFSAIGTWIEANAYEIAGPCREVFLEPVTDPPGLQGALVEIQFPVRRAA